MTRTDGTFIAGGDLGLPVRFLRAATAAAATVLPAVLLGACNMAPGRLDLNGHYLGPDTTVSVPDWGVVESTEPLHDNTMLVSIATCLRRAGGMVGVGTQQEFETAAGGPDGGLELVGGDGFVTAPDGAVYPCSVVLRASESSSYAPGSVVPIPQA